MTVEQIKQTRVMVKEAGEKGFTYDASEDYESFLTSVQSYADSEGITVKEYYKQNFGEYATQKNIEPFVRENMLASAYYSHLLEENAATDEEVGAYYDEHKQDYDKVDYRSFIFTAELAEDADDVAIADAMKELEGKANAMTGSPQGRGRILKLSALKMLLRTPGQIMRTQNQSTALQKGDILQVLLL